MDRNSTLCMTCSSSLPPVQSKSLLYSEARATVEGIFMTACCNRPICPKCRASNPRLARYNPCLACLGGVGAVSSRDIASKSLNVEHTSRNVDGAVRDEDTFAIGDDEDDEDESVDENNIQTPSTDISLGPPPPYPTSLPSSSSLSASSALAHIEPNLQESTLNAHSDHSDSPPAVSANGPPVPLKYHIKPGDTLQGIALKFGVNGRELCRLNKLPPSTLNTTPHILHTRNSLVLPPSARSKAGNQPVSGEETEEDKERQAMRARECAEKRLQTLTKEVDWRVAKAYVALADDPDEAHEYGRKAKEGVDASNKRIGTGSGQGSLEVMAVGRYLDDEEWEANERREGRGVKILPFPFVNGHSTGRKEGTRSWWNW